MYKGIAGSEGIGIGNVVIIEEHEIVIENKKITDTDAEIARLQGAIEKFVNDTNARQNGKDSRSKGCGYPSRTYPDASGSDHRGADYSAHSK